MSDKQHTLAAPVTLSGKGLHTGQEVTITINPAPENHGIVFCRTDVEGKPAIKADVDFVTALERSTTIASNGNSISTIEHCMAALMGSGIDNVQIDIDGPEVPILDGSAKPFTDAFTKAGLTEQAADRNYVELKEIITYTDAERGVELMAIPANGFRLTVMVDYKSPVVGLQYATLNALADFNTEIAACRTFVFLHELKALIENNLIKGGDVNNALVIADRPLATDDMGYLHKAFPERANIEVKDGYLNNVDTHFDNEPARHKLLDVVGDLALLGKRLKAHVIATRPGHAANVSFAKLIKEEMKKQAKQKYTAPAYNPNIAPLYDVNRIMETLPHRPPFLLVDKIIEMGEAHVVGVKNITMNEPFFQGHFPGNPVMPGVLQIEAMAQAGGILALSTVPDPENYSTYFLKIDGVKFKAKVVPGDTLVFKLNLTEPIRRGIVQMHGEAFVGDKLVMEADLMAQIVKEKNLDK